MYNKFIGAALFVLLMDLCNPTIAHGDVFGGIVDVVGTITLVKPALHSLGESLGGGMRSEMDGYIRQEVEPLLQEADAIIRGNIRGAADEMLRVLKEVEASCNRLLKEGSTLAMEAIREVRVAGHALLEHLRSILQETLCQLGDSRGIIIALPIVGSVNTIKVIRPSRTHCYRDLPSSQGSPQEAIFEGWQYYAGEECEAELILSEIDPMDSESIKKMANAYAEVASRARDAFCRMPSNELKTRMMVKWHHAELEADFFFRLPSMVKRNVL